jgi:hypothetical protein
MKLTTTSVILLETLIALEYTPLSFSKPRNSNQQHSQDPSPSRRKRNLNKSHLSLLYQNGSSHQTLLSPSSAKRHSPLLRSGRFHISKRGPVSGALKNATQVHDVPNNLIDSLVECLPQATNKSTSEADVGILGCGMGEYCLESTDYITTTLGGICVKLDDVVERNDDKGRDPLDQQGPLNRNGVSEECDPWFDPTPQCKSQQQCLQDVRSEKGGFCIDSLSESSHFWSRFRSLQKATYSYSELFDFIQYSCNYKMDPFTCDCTKDAATGSMDVSCEYEASCETRTTPCIGDFSNIEYCKRLTIEAQGTGPGDFEFNLCYGYLSPVDIIYCYQIISNNGLLSCTMYMGDEQCASCDLDPQNICIDFNCRNTASGRAGNLCADTPLGDPAILDLLDCSGSCNICGDGGKLVNYNHDLGSVLSSADCYSPLFCDGSSLSCEQIQEVALVGGLVGGDSCNVAPDFDLYSICCVDSLPGVTPPPLDDPPGKLPCMAFDHDCFGCIENEDCFWCPGDALCSSSTTFVDTVNIFEREHSCKTPEDYTTETCTDPGNFFSDPLYSSQEWVFEMIKVREVWEKGYTGKGIRVRVNDEGIESTHPEFEGRIDVDASCTKEVEPVPNTYETGFSHGTAVASILGAAAGNGVCGVGIAPNVTMSSCYFNSNHEFAELFIYKLEMFDISQNSWGRDTCTDLDESSRRLQGTDCPFKYDQSHVFPCLFCDFNNLQEGTLPH